MELGELIRAYRVEHGMSQRAFALKCGNVTNGYISMIEAGENPATKKPLRLSLEKLMGIARGLDMTLQDLVNRVSNLPADIIPPPPPAVPGFETLPYAPPRAMVPVLGAVRCGPGGLALEEAVGMEPADVANAQEYFYLRAEGDSMEPKIFEGDLVLVHRQPRIDSGDLAVVLVNGEEGTLKKYVEKSGAIILQSLNPKYPPRVFVGREMDAVSIVGRAAALVRKW